MNSQACFLFAFFIKGEPKLLEASEGRTATAAAAAAVAGAGGEGSGAGTGTAAARTRPASPAPARRPRARRPGRPGGGVGARLGEGEIDLHVWANRPGTLLN